MTETQKDEETAQDGVPHDDPEPSPWRQVPGTDALCRDIPPATFTALVCRRFPLVFVMPSEGGTYVVEDEDGVKLGSHLSVAEACEAADQAVELMRPDLEARMIRAEGLDPGEWSVCRDGDVVSVRNSSGTRTITPRRRDDGATVWHAAGVVEDLGCFDAAPDAAVSPEVHLDEEGVPHST